MRLALLVMPLALAFGLTACGLQGTDTRKDEAAAVRAFNDILA